MAFCQNCGAKLQTGARFCSACGVAVGDIDNENERKEVFEGGIHKCPNCGERLKAFEPVCPTCGYQLRSAGKQSGLMKKFSERITKFTSYFDEADYIRSFAVPNTIEDIMEFLILATENIENPSAFTSSYRGRRDRADAWISKSEQVYEKANLTFGNLPQFKSVERIYKKARRKARRSNFARGFKSFLSWCWELCYEHGEIALGVFLMLLFLGIGASFIISASIKHNASVKKETQRLEIIYKDVLDLIDKEDYEAAKIKTNLIEWGVSTKGWDNNDTGKEQTRIWKNKKESLLKMIDDSQAAGKKQEIKTK